LLSNLDNMLRTNCRFTWLILDDLS